MDGLLAFQRLRLLNLRTAGLFGNFTLDNFDEVFASAGFWGSLGTTLVYSVLGTAVGDRPRAGRRARAAPPFRGRTLVRAAMLLPYVAPIVAVTFVWRTMLNPQFGVVNYWGTAAARLGRADRVPERGSGEVSVLGHFTSRRLLTVIAFEAWR